MKKIKSTIFEQWIGSFSTVSAQSRKTIEGYRPKFSVVKNISFSNASRIANKFARTFKNIKLIKF